MDGTKGVINYIEKFKIGLSVCLFTKDTKIDHDLLETWNYCENRKISRARLLKLV